jgi:hypothetical protein
VDRFDLPLPDAESEAALACAAAHARRYLLSRRMFRLSVLSADAAVQTYDRVLHNIEHRELQLKVAPGGTGPIGPIPDPSARDPWSVNPATIENDTRTNSQCPYCGGSGIVACPICHGTTRAPCSNCSGSGKVFSQRKNQLFKNCPQCRGSGRQHCTNCRSGRVPCDPCEASGRVTAWLTLEQTPRTEVVAHPMNAGARVHARLKDPQDFDGGAWPNRLQTDTGIQTNLSVGPELAPRLDRRADRVTSGRRQAFSAVVRRFTFGTPVGGGAVEVAGTPPIVSPTSRWTGLWLRITFAVLLASAGIGASAFLYVSYLSRHAWYEKHGAGIPLVLFGIATSLCFAAILAGLLVRRPARSLLGILVPTGGAVAFALGVVLAFTHARPTLSHARDRVAAGDLEGAQDEARAVLELRLDAVGASDFLDKLHLRRAKALRTVGDLARCIREPWQDSKAQAEAVALLRAIAQAESAKLYGSRNGPALTALGRELEDLAPDLSGAVGWMASVARAAAMVEGGLTVDATAELAEVVKLAPRVPDSLRPPTAVRVTEAAEKLRTALAAANAKPMRDRSKALAAAYEPTKAFAVAVGADPEVAQQGVARAAQDVTRELARMSRRGKKKGGAEPAGKGGTWEPELPALLRTNRGAGKPEAPAAPSEKPSGADDDSPYKRVDE